jgi:hypothetical protein
VEAVFSPPMLYQDPEYLKIISTTNTNCFGYWQCGQSPIAVETGYLYHATFNVITDISDKSIVPQIRLRANSSNLQQSDYVSIESSGGGESCPEQTGTNYDLYFIPPVNDSSVTLAFDLLNFNPGDAPDAQLWLDSVTVRRYMIESLTTPTVVQDYGFETVTEGWTSGGAPAVFTMPMTSHASGELQLAATTNTDTFGYWQSDSADITIESGKLYRGTFEIRTDVTDQSKVPQMRLRFNASNLQASRTLGIESSGDGGSSPGTSNTKYDNLFFMPPASCAGEGMIVAFDVLNFSPDDAADGSLMMDSALIESMSPPSLP